MEKQHSFWEREEWLTPPDLLITGGGIVGASTALFYKEKYPDHDVIIADKGITPEGASTRNAGFSCIGSVSEHLADLEISGEETVFNRIERRWNGLQLLRKTIGDDVMDYENTGGFEIFKDDAIYKTCADKITWFNQKLMDRLGLDDVYSESEYEGYPAIFNRVEGAINSGKLMRNLYERLAKAGVRIWWNCKAERIDSSSVLFESGLEMKPKKTVVAVNGFTQRLEDLPIKPARGFVLVTKPIQDFKWKGTFHYDEGYVYFRNVGDRLLLGGGRNVAKDEETTDQFGTNQKIREYLTQFANDTLKLPENWEIDIEWSGIMGMTENKEPIIQQIKPGVWVAAGLSGMGIAIGMQVAADLVKSLD
ncbi:MAG: FAD-binding oxidoreductase [Balneolaceae bacterium]|nr:MAG: FAD-binding oxidoreductase [Balneolaceae bacterium]